jgi:carbamoyltransferase
MYPRIENGRDIINKIKNREFYRPFGASVLSKFKKEYFDLDFENPYMLYVGTTQKNNLKSITHIDGTCRVQTISEPGHFRTLLEKFYNITTCPVLLNTSLNNSGKPIAGYKQNAIDEFKNTDIDVLVIGNKIYQKFLSVTKKIIIY